MATHTVPQQVLEFRKQVGSNLRRHRLQKGYAQRTVAAELTLATGAISMWEAGKRPLTLDHLYRFARYYGVEPAVLVESRDVIC